MKPMLFWEGDPKYWRVLIARGNTLAHILNGQVHVGPPMKVEYRNVRLKGL